MKFFGRKTVATPADNSVAVAQARERREKFNAESRYLAPHALDAYAVGYGVVKAAMAQGNGRRVSDADVWRVLQEQPVSRMG